MNVGSTFLGQMKQMNVCLDPMESIRFSVGLTITATVHTHSPHSANRHECKKWTCIDCTGNGSLYTQILNDESWEAVQERNFPNTKITQKFPLT